MTRDPQQDTPTPDARAEMGDDDAVAVKLTVTPKRVVLTLPPAPAADGATADAGPVVPRDDVPREG